MLVGFLNGYLQEWYNGHFEEMITMIEQAQRLDDTEQLFVKFDEIRRYLRKNLDWRIVDDTARFEFTAGSVNKTQIINILSLWVKRAWDIVEAMDKIEMYLKRVFSFRQKIQQEYMYNTEPPRKRQRLV